MGNLNDADIPQIILDVCKLGQGEKCCSYLGFGTGWQCLKKSEFKSLIDKRRAEKTMNAMGDNCEGKTQQELYENSGNRTQAG